MTTLIGFFQFYFHRVRQSLISPKYSYNASYHEHAIMKDISIFPSDPTFSVIIPVYDPDIILLNRAVNSVKNQIYPHWELWIIDDGSKNKKITKYLSRLNNSKIHVRTLKDNSGVSAACNEGISISSGEYIAFLDHDDELTPDALYEISIAIRKGNPDILYSDEDIIRNNHEYISAHFKPDFSPDLLLSHNYITHLLVVRRPLLIESGGFRSEYNGAQDYDLILRLTDTAKTVCHIRKVLYHWRFLPRSQSHRKVSRNKCSDAGFRCLEDTLKRRSVEGHVENTELDNHFRVVRSINGNPLISLILIGNENRQVFEKCIFGFFSIPGYTNFELLLIPQGFSQRDISILEDKFADLSTRKISILTGMQDTSFPGLLNSVLERTNGEYSLFSCPIFPQPYWIDALLEHAQRKDVGAVGGKVLYPNHTVMHAGHILGIHGLIGLSHNGFPERSGGYFHRLNLIQNVISVSPYFMMVKKSLYQEAGGMDEQHYSSSLCGADFCLTLHEMGYLNVYTPFCQAVSAVKNIHLLPGSGRTSSESDFFRERFRGLLESGDPFYNRNLTLEREDFGYADEIRGNSYGMTARYPKTGLWHYWVSR
jgi:glycosyltransferase involved in cell wall biosynthesis